MPRADGMDFGLSGNQIRVDLAELGQRIPGSVKILVAGGFGVGKTTLVGTVSEIGPLRTEEVLSGKGAVIDDTTKVAWKTTTTVVMDFGRITVGDDLVLYLFGTPSQDRFSFVWDELAQGAIGAVVLVDTRRLSAAFSPIGYFERRGTPYVVAVNAFDDAPWYHLDEVRSALNLDPRVPLVSCDVRRRDSAKQALISLVELVMSRTAVPI